MATAQLPEEITEGLSGLTIGDPETSEESKNDDPNPAIRMGLLNVRSIKTQRVKREKLREVITERELEVFFPTETWLTTNTEEAALRQASPEGYKVCHQSREEGRGGGVGIQVSPGFTEVPPYTLDLGSFTTFEYVAAELKHNDWDQEVLFINLYRPGKLKETPEFLEEFEGLLKDFSEKYHSVLITGDFNIWFDEADKKKNKYPQQKHAEEFLELLRKFNFLQHVEGPTHEKGHTLDLVISRNVKISDLTVEEVFKVCKPCSDHKLIVFKARPVPVPVPEAETEENEE